MPGPVPSDPRPAPAAQTAVEAAAELLGVEPVLYGTPVTRADPSVSSRISREPLSVDALLGAVSRPEVGGIALFVGIVRDHDRPSAPSASASASALTAETDRPTTDRVDSLDYTAHPTAEHELHASAVRAADGHDVVAVAVEHRIGHLEVGDLAVVVAVGAVHRGPALDACRTLIDDLKQTVPIWKEQRFSDGAVEWVGL